MSCPTGAAPFHPKNRQPVNPETYEPQGPYALSTHDLYHNCGIETLSEGVEEFVRYGHPVSLEHTAWAALSDSQGVMVLGWYVNVWNDDPVFWFGIPAATDLFADSPLVDPLEAEIVMSKIKDPA